MQQTPRAPRCTHVVDRGLLSRAAPRAVEQAKVRGRTQRDATGRPSGIVERAEEQAEGALWRKPLVLSQGRARACAARDCSANRLPGIRRTEGRISAPTQTHTGVEACPSPIEPRQVIGLHLTEVVIAAFFEEVRLRDDQRPRLRDEVDKLRRRDTRVLQTVVGMEAGLREGTCCENELRATDAMDRDASFLGVCTN